MTERVEAAVSIHRIDNEYTIGGLQDGTGMPREPRPDVVELRLWNLSDLDDMFHARKIVVTAEDLWLLAELRMAGTKKRAAEIAYRIAGLPPRKGEQR